MQKMNKFDILSTREHFNAVVRHIKTTIALSDHLAGKENIADVLLQEFFISDFSGDQVSAFLSMLLKDKLGYEAVSCNLDAVLEDLSSISTEVSKWNAVDIVMTYQHPDVGLLVVNPKSNSQISALTTMRKHELVVVYAGTFGSEQKNNIAKKAATTLVSLIQSFNVPIDKAFYEGPFKYSEKSVMRRKKLLL